MDLCFRVYVGVHIKRKHTYIYSDMMHPWPSETNYKGGESVGNRGESDIKSGNQGFWSPVFTCVLWVFVKPIPSRVTPL